MKNGEQSVYDPSRDLAKADRERGIDNQYGGFDNIDYGHAIFWKPEHQVAALREKLDRLTGLLVEGILDAVSYQRERDRLQEQVAAAEIEREQSVIEHLDVTVIVNFAEATLTNASALWEGASLADKHRLQAALFPEGLTWQHSSAAAGARGIAAELRTGGFSNRVTCLAFNEMPEFSDYTNGLVTRAGIEPATPCLKGRCSTD